MVLIKEDETRQIMSIRLFFAAALALDAWTIVEKIQQAYGVGSFLGHYSGSRLLNTAPVVLLTVLEILVLWMTFSRPAPVSRKGRKSSSGVVSASRPPRLANPARVPNGPVF